MKVLPVNDVKAHPIIGYLALGRISANLVSLDSHYVVVQ
jgi:hypothetical protein